MVWTSVDDIQAESCASYVKDMERKALIGDILSKVKQSHYRPW
jgi:hypothetical protein